MGDVTCRRCGTSGPALGAAPLPGDIGRALLEGTCAACWSAWLGEQVKWINEYQLNPSDPEHYERLIGEMTTYLKLNEQSEES